MVNEDVRNEITQTVDDLDPEMATGEEKVEEADEDELDEALIRLLVRHVIRERYEFQDRQGRHRD